MSFSNYLELKVLDHLRGGTAWTQPTALYIKFHLGDPGEDCTLNPAVETTRTIGTFDDVSAAGQFANTAIISLASVSTAETYSHFSAWDAIGPTGGNPLGYGALGTAKAVTVGETVQFAIGALVVALD